MRADDIADALFGAIERGDVDAVAALYADDAVIWHNFDNVEQDRDANLAVLSWMTRRVRDLRYEEIARYEIDGGFVQQHVLRATTESGETLKVPGCIVVHLHDDRIGRIDEYLDSAHLSPLTG